MTLREAIQVLQKSEAWDVFRREYLEKAKELQLQGILLPARSESDTFRAERLKGALDLINKIFAIIELNVPAQEGEDADVLEPDTSIPTE
jgi:hypothetical protein